MKARAVSVVAGLALWCCARPSAAQRSGPVQLAWQAPANCPQAAQVRQKLRDLLGNDANDAAPSRLRAEGLIEPSAGRFRLTLNIHYDTVNGTRVVEGDSCEDLGGVAAITLALLFRTARGSGAPLTAADLGGADAAAAESPQAGADQGSSTSTPPAEKPASDERGHAPESEAAEPSSFRFAFRLPELRADVGVLPDASFGVGLSLGLRHEAWRVLASGTAWLAQDHDSPQFVGYGADFGRVSGELSACHGFPFASLELAPCLLVSLDVVSARGSGVGISSTNPRTTWLSLGAGVQGLWHLNRHLALVLGLGGRVPTSRPHFVSESVGEIAQVGPAALSFSFGCEWTL